MKFILWLTIFILYFFRVSLYSQAGDETIIAVVGAHSITLSQFADRYTDYLMSTGIKDNVVVRRAILDNMINEILLYNYDSNEKIFSSSEFKKELDAARDKTILGYLKEQEIYAKIEVSEEEMRKAFSRINEKIAARHLYAATEEEAYNLYELVKIGVPFETLAEQTFTDSTLKNNGGYLGYFTWGDMDPAFEEAAYSLKVGEISQPVQTAHGYSIIKVEDRNPYPFVTEYEYQNKKYKLEEIIKIQKKIPAEKEYLKRIFDIGKLSYNDESLENILTSLKDNPNIESGIKKTFSSECVTYDGKTFSQSEIEKRISNLPYYHRNKIISVGTLKAVIEGLLIRDILLEIAANKGYDTVKSVSDMYEGYRKNIFLKYKMDEITKESYIPDSELIDFYKTNIHLFSNESELNLQEILVEDPNIADSLLKLISEGADFGKLANEFSLRSWSADNDGVLGFAPLSKFGSYKDLFWKTPVGEVLGPLKIENFYGIFRVLGKTEGKPMDFNLIKNEVTKAAQFENQTNIVRDYLGLIRKKVNIKINNDLLGSYSIAG